MLSADEMNRRYFRGAYRTGEHGWEVDTPSPYALDFLGRLSKLVPGGALLDIGCGEGRHALAAARTGFRVTAIDYERLALRRAQEIAGSSGMAHTALCNADVFHLPFRNARFDVVLDYGCLHHQRKADWPLYKAGVIRVLKPGGFIVLSVFSPRFRFFVGRGRPWHLAYGAYRRCFTKRDIGELFSPQFDVFTMTEERGEHGGFWHVLMAARS